MRHLVLGSEGQIGKYVCDEIERRGDQLVRWDIALDPSHDLAMVNGELEYQASLADFVHFLAFNVGGSKYLNQHQNSLFYLQNNLDIMSNTFEVLRKTKTPFYFASSQMSNMIDSVYGQLKAIGESYTKALGGVNVKFWNVYGYESNLEKSHVITDFIRMMFEQNRIICRTNGQEERHFSYAPDIAYMLYQLTNPKYYDAAKNRDNMYWTTDSALHIAIDKGWYKIVEVAELVCQSVWRYRGDTTNQTYPTYFSRLEDKTQTITNYPQVHHTLELLDLPYNFGYPLRKGIDEMVELIGQEYKEKVNI